MHRSNCIESYTLDTYTHVHTHTPLTRNMIVKPFDSRFGPHFCCTPRNIADSLLSLGFHLLKSISDLLVSIRIQMSCWHTLCYHCFLTIFIEITYIFKAISHSSYLSFITVPHTFSIIKTGTFGPRANHRFQSSG